jgi:hypothetical protein
MAKNLRDLVFLSYSRKDPEICKAVRQCLIDQGLAGSLWDDTKIRLGEQWDDKIQDGMDRAAVAVLIFSDGYFGRRQDGGEYILQRELPYLIEHYKTKEIDLLPVYWRPSVHCRPDRHDPVKPFEYLWKGQPRSFEIHSIQALARNGCLADAPEATRRDALLDLAAEAERRLEDRLASVRSPLVPPETQGRQSLTVELAIDDAGLRRIFKLAGQVVPLAPPVIPRAELDALRIEAERSLPEPDDQAAIGRRLGRLLLGGRNEGDLFPRLAEMAFDLPPGSTARTRALAVELRCGPVPCDPWPLRLPWHLTAVDGEPLATGCGWSFEACPPRLRPGGIPVLSPDPPILLLVGAGVPGRDRHGTELIQHLERIQGFAADPLRCADLGRLATSVQRTPEPEILYAYARADLDLMALAEALGERVSLILLNLIGDAVPAPPSALVRDRKLVICTHASIESGQARTAGTRWLQAFLTDTAGVGHQRLAIDAFGPRVRLWSGCAGLHTRVSAARGHLFRRSLIKLLLDRVTARREVSDEVAAALSQGRGVLGLVAAGTGDDHPDLLPKQVWHHYQTYREAGSRDAIRRFSLDPGGIPDADELLPRFAQSLGRGSDDWQDGLDREAGDLSPGDRLVLSLEWRLGPCPADQDEARWRSDWITACLDLGTRHLASYHRTGVLLVQWLIVEAADSGAAETWSKDAQGLWRERRSGLSSVGRRFVHLPLKPLSLVPVDDIEYFLEHHYHLPELYPDIALEVVAEWVCSETGGVFAKAVELVERLHDTGFQTLPPTARISRSPSP